MAVNFYDSGQVTVTTSAVMQYGMVEIEMVIPSSNVHNGTFRAKTLPSLKIDFDAKEGFGDLSDVKINLSDVEFEFFDTYTISDVIVGSPYDSLFRRISNMGVDDVITIKVTVNGRTDYFISSRQNVDYDWQSRSCKIKGTSALKYDVQVLNYSMPSGFKINADYDSNGGTDYSFPGGVNAGSVLSGDLLYRFLLTQGKKDANSFMDVVVVSPFFNYTKFGVENGGARPPWNMPDNRDKYIGFIASPTWKTADSDAEDVSIYSDAQRKVLQMGILEGAIIGSMMGYSFYIPRMYNIQENITDFTGSNTYTSYADINSDDISSFSMSPHEFWAGEYNTNFSIYNKYSFDQKKEDVEGLNQLSGNGFGSKNVNLSYFMQAQILSYYDNKWWMGYADGQRILDEGINQINKLDLSFLVTKDGLNHNTRVSYANALGISLPTEPFGVSFYKTRFPDSSKFKFEMEILGIDKVLPFQFIKFGSSGIHPSVNGKRLRPSLLEYNLQSNKINIEGYLIE